MITSPPPPQGYIPFIYSMMGSILLSEKQTGHADKLKQDGANSEHKTESLQKPDHTKALSVTKGEGFLLKPSSHYYNLTLRREEVAKRQQFFPEIHQRSYTSATVKPFAIQQDFK